MVWCSGILRGVNTRGQRVGVRPKFNPLFDLATNLTRLVPINFLRKMDIRKKILREDQISGGKPVTVMNLSEIVSRKREFCDSLLASAL